MPRSIDKVKDIFFALVFIVHLDSVGFYGNSSLLFQIHIIKSLRLQLPLCHCISILQKSVCQGRFTVVNMCNDAKISYIFHFKNQYPAKITKKRLKKSISFGINLFSLMFLFIVFMLKGILNFLFYFINFQNLLWRKVFQQFFGVKFSVIQNLLRNFKTKVYLS